jgi:hypothetical protein
VNSLTIDDCWTGAKAFPKILDTKELSVHGSVVENNQHKQAFIFTFESNDDMVIAPFRI